MAKEKTTNGNGHSLVDVKLTDIKRAEYNSPSRTEDKTLAPLMKDLAENGLFQPILLDKNHNLIDGHRRLACATKLNWSTIKAIVLDIDSDHTKAVYESVNTTAKRFNEADQLFIFTHGGIVPKRIEKAINTISEILGKDSSEIFKVMYKRRTSPTHICNVLNKLNNYCTISDTKAALAWIAKHETSYRLGKAMKAGISPKSITNAIKKDRPLKEIWV